MSNYGQFPLGEQLANKNQASNDLLDNYLTDYYSSSPVNPPDPTLNFQYSENLTGNLAPSSQFNQDGLSDTATSLLQSAVSTPLSSPLYGIHGSAQSSSSAILSPTNYNQMFQQQTLFQNQLLSPTDVTSPPIFDSNGLYPQDDGFLSPTSPHQGQFLIPGKMGHHRSNSTYSEASSTAHSPAFRATSPILPISANSPHLFDDSLVTMDNLEQLAGFTLDDTNMTGQLTLEIPQNYSNIYNSSNGFDNGNFLAISPTATPEITIDIVDPPGPSHSPYNSSPGPLSPFSDHEPFPALDSFQGLLPPSSIRRRAHSESELEGALPQSDSLYSINSPSNGSVSSVSSETNYLSPEVAISERGSHSRHNRHRSSSASQVRDRSRSRSQSASREYILELASLAPGSKKVQRHPSAFACDLCDKRFTRAYNLRSHKRTHTNERPYVCSLCPKAFARQHDRKRHEALHSGEKKYECTGFLADGVTQWGCGHKFARADALGRHFRTEAGKECIRALVEESEREKNHQRGGGGGGGVPIYDGNEDAPALTLSPPANEASSTHGILNSATRDSSSASYFPAALLEQFPMLSELR